MLSLEAAQLALADALDHGPAFLPDRLFDGAPDRVLAGLKIHANTISHARLVALEETFPRTRDAMGHARFNAVSRTFLDLPGVTGCPLALIGAAFPTFLQSGYDRAFAGLALFEWAWLDCYHARDAMPLSLSDLAGYDAAALLGILVERHPSAHLVPITPAMREALDNDRPGLDMAAAVLVTRPDAEVQVTPATLAMVQMFDRAAEQATLGDLIGADPDEDAMPAMIGLFEAGALCSAGVSA